MNNINIKELANKASYWGIIAFSASLFLQPTINTICFIFGILAWLINYLLNKKTSLNNKNTSHNQLLPIHYLILIQLLIDLIFSFIHNFTELNYLVLMKDLFKSYIPWFWFISILSQHSNKQKNNAIYIFIYFSIFISLLCCLQSFGLFVISSLGPSGLQKQPYTTGALILIAFFLTLYLLEITYKIKTIYSKKYFLYLALFIQFVGIMAISQRAILLGLFIGIIYWIIANRKFFTAQFYLFFFGINILLLPLAYYFFPKFRLRIISVLKPSTDLIGLGCRLEVWKKNWESFLSSIWTGTGKAIKFNCYGDILGHAHNIFLQKLVINGLIGFSVWFIFILFIIRKILSKKIYSAFIACLIALLIEGLFENWLGDSEVRSAFWFFLSIALI